MKSLLVAAGVAFLITIALVILSLGGSLYSGPAIHQEITQHYLPYAVFAIGRLALAAFLISLALSGLGSLCYTSLMKFGKWKYSFFLNVLSALAAFLVFTLLQFSHQLFHYPSSIVASFNYDIRRLYPFWELLTAERIELGFLLASALFLSPIFARWVLDIRNRAWKSAGVILMAGCAGASLVWGANHAQEPAKEPLLRHPARPNIVMIGSDTLRADRLGVSGNPRKLTPAIDSLARVGVNFKQHIIPLARTAPSLASLLTSTWPTTHGVRDNFVTDIETRFPVTTLPQILRQNGYLTEAIGDWAASDLGKFDYGFDRVDTAPDQWNFKYLLRQGPKDLRLFVSLFTHNRIGKALLPELYFLAGVPLTAEIGLETRNRIHMLARTGKPFFQNVFVAATHGPFGSAFPYYRLYADPAYRGNSLFAMGAVSSVDEIVKSQSADRRNFDVRQIVDLYDGAVRSFDDEVGKLLNYLRDTGLDRNTIVIIYSDHGVDLFESETWGQGNILSDYSYRTPLVIRDPRLLSSKEIDATVSSIDIAPTVLELAGIKPPTQWQGISLVPLIKGDVREEVRIAFAETGVWIANVRGLPKERIPYPPIMELLEIRDKHSGTLSFKPQYFPTLIRAKARMARQGKWALVYFPLATGPIYQLFDMISDPAMKYDLAEAHPDVVAKLRGPLDRWINGEAQ
jgi:arylsulfatase A-like enzyme